MDRARDQQADDFFAGPNRPSMFRRAKDDGVTTAAMAVIGMYFSEVAIWSGIARLVSSIEPAAFKAKVPAADLPVVSNTLFIAIFAPSSRLLYRHIGARLSVVS